jgi:hypothetical protein
MLLKKNFKEKWYIIQEIKKTYHKMHPAQKGDVNLRPDEKII